jgi:hypothetical protein
MFCVEDSIASDRLWEAASLAGVTSLAFAASSAPVVRSVGRVCCAVLVGFIE